MANANRNKVFSHKQSSDALATSYLGVDKFNTFSNDQLGRWGKLGGLSKKIALRANLNTGLSVSTPHLQANKFLKLDRYATIVL